MQRRKYRPQKYQSEDKTNIENDDNDEAFFYIDVDSDVDYALQRKKNKPKKYQSENKTNIENDDGDNDDINDETFFDNDVDSDVDDALKGRKIDQRNTIFEGLIAQMSIKIQI